MKLEIKDFTEIINEKKFAEEIISENYIDYSHFSKIITLLARYCHCVYGYGKAKTIAFLRDYVEENCIFYIKKERRDALFNRAYKLATKREICDSDGFWITQSELEKISELHNKVLERLAFCFLCYAKLNKLRNPSANGWVYKGEQTKVNKLGRINMSKNDYEISIGELIERGYLKLYTMPNEEEWLKMSVYAQQKYRSKTIDVQVTYMNDDSEPVIFVDDFRELGYFYSMYKGENIIKCEKCGRLTRNNKRHTKKYCGHCSNSLSLYVLGEKQCRCIECGKVFSIDKHERAKKRCNECAKMERKRHNAIMYQKRKNKNSTILEKD